MTAAAVSATANREVRDVTALSERDGRAATADRFAIRLHDLDILWRFAGGVALVARVIGPPTDELDTHTFSVRDIECVGIEGRVIEARDTARAIRDALPPLDLPWRPRIFQHQPLSDTWQAFEDDGEILDFEFPEDRERVPRGKKQKGRRT